MTRTDNYLTRIAVVIGGLLTTTAALASGTLVVHFAGMANDDGVVVASLVDSPQQFLSRQHRPKHTHSLVVKAGEAIWTLNNLAYGKYAITAYHDANSNAELDTGLFGIPTEDYGFSNNARGGLGPPDYADAEFDFTRSGQSLIIRID